MLNMRTPINFPIGHPTERLYRQHILPWRKGISARDIVKILKEVGPLYLDGIAIRMKHFTYDQYKLLGGLLKERKLVHGRFMGTKLFLIPSDELPLYAKVFSRSSQLTSVEKQILHIIDQHGPISKLELKRLTGLNYSIIHKGVERLDLNFLIQRVGYENPKSFISRWLWDLTSKVLPNMNFDEYTQEEAEENLLIKFFRSFGRSTYYEILGWLGMPSKRVSKILNRLILGGFLHKNGGSLKNSIFIPNFRNNNNVNHFVDIHSFCVLLDTQDPLIRSKKRWLKLDGKNLGSSFCPCYFYILFKNQIVGTVHHSIIKGDFLPVHDLVVRYVPLTSTFFKMIINSLADKARLHNYHKIILEKINHRSINQKTQPLLEDLEFRFIGNKALKTI